MNSASLLRIWASKLSRIRASGRVEVLSVVRYLEVDVLARRDDVLADDLGAAATVKVDGRATACMVRGHEHCLSVFVVKIMLRKHST